MLGKDLQQQLSQVFAKKTWTINPLSAIGISPVVLGLGLSEEQLFLAVQRWAKMLFVLVHPDRPSEGVPGDLASQQRFGEAFNLLKDRETFRRALQELRVQRSGQRDDINVARREAFEASHLANELAQRLNEERKQRLKLADREQSVGKTFLAYLKGQALRPHPPRRLFQNTWADATKFIATADVKQLLAISIMVSPPLPRRAVTDPEYALGSQTGGKKKYKFQRRRFAETPQGEKIQKARKKGVFLGKTADLFAQALQSGYLAPGINWDESEAIRLLGFVKSKTKAKVQVITEESKRMPEVFCPRRDTTTNYRQALCNLGQTLARRYPLVVSLFVKPVALKLENGRLDDDQVVLGTVPLEILGEAEEVEMLGGRPRLIKSAEIIPFLSNRRVLLTMHGSEFSCGEDELAIANRLCSGRESIYCSYIVLEVLE